jgi:serine/threonine protein kinase
VDSNNEQPVTNGGGGEGAGEEPSGVPPDSSEVSTKSQRELAAVTNYNSAQNMFIGKPGVGVGAARAVTIVPSAAMQEQGRHEAEAQQTPDAAIKDMSTPPDVHIQDGGDVGTVGNGIASVHARAEVADASARKESKEAMNHDVTVPMSENFGPHDAQRATEPEYFLQANSRDVHMQIQTGAVVFKQSRMNIDTGEASPHYAAPTLRKTGSVANFMNNVSAMFVSSKIDPTGSNSVKSVFSQSPKMPKVKSKFKFRQSLKTSGRTGAGASGGDRHTGHPVSERKVALKFIIDRLHFKREVDSRALLGKYEPYVVPLLRSFDADEDAEYAREIEVKDLLDYRFCLVMPCAEKNLQSIILTERFAGKDWNIIRTLAIQIAEAAAHLHEHGILHGDIRPLNIMRMNNRMKLIDFGSCASLGSVVSSQRVSTAYLAPEMFHKDEFGDFHVKLPELHIPTQVQPSGSDGYTNVHDSNTVYDLDDNNDRNTSAKPNPGPELSELTMLAHYSLDAWSYGLVLYELCSGGRFLLGDDEDQIDDDEIIDLYEMTNTFRRKKLKKIKNSIARNLVSQLLSKDPRARPDMRMVLDHPFLSGRAMPRLRGQRAR